VKFFLILILLISHAAFSSEVSIRVNPHSVVKGKSLTLGDIAAFTGFTNSEVQNLRKIALGNAPAFGEKRNYSNHALTEILRVHLKRIQDRAPKRITLQIPEEVSIEGNGKTISKETLTQQLKENLRAICEECDFRVEDLRIPEIPPFAPDNTWSIRADFHKLKGPFNFPVEIVNPVGEKSIHWITGRISVWKKVPVSTRVLGVQDRLEVSDFKWALRDITFLHDSTPDENEMIGSQVKMSVGPDQIIVKGHLVRKKALSRGDSVTITTGQSGWNITLRGVAQENGFVGDTVKVLNPDTKKIISGTVVSDGTVEVR
jgi:flagella basal body P-ring formation protein FlgA